MSKKEKKNKKEKKEEKQNKKRKKGKEVKVEEAAKLKLEALYIDRILPIIDFDEDTGIGVMEDGTLCDCFSINCKDLNSITDDDLAMDILTWEKLYKTYAGDLKIVSFSFPADTKEQQQYTDYKITVTENPILKQLLKTKQDELEIVHVNYLTREAALFFFSKNAEEYKKNYSSLRILLTNSMTPLISPMSIEKKKKIFFKMCNKNLNH